MKHGLFYLFYIIIKKMKGDITNIRKNDSYKYFVKTILAVDVIKGGKQ
jgi:hypothetical protein